MIDGSGGLNPYCPEYTSPATSQLAAAVAFLEAHPGHVSLVTIDIGANDVDGCFNPAETVAEIESCVAAALPTMATNLGEIVGALAAADRGGHIVGMNYYDPFLADWLSGSTGETLAEGSAELAVAVNGELASVYAHFGVPVADIAGAFQTTNFNLIPFIRIPFNVALICAWTWMCAPAPYGAPNSAAIHANDLGYAVIAGTFLARLRESGFLR